MSKSKFNKQDLLDKIQISINDALSTSLSKRNTRNIFNSVLAVLTDHIVALDDKETLVIPGFGSFSLKNRTFTIRPGLVGAKDLKIPVKVDRNVVTFRPSKMLKDRIK
jgi:nucleoid DNA-binding protein